jgi:hypothetical protein
MCALLTGLGIGIPLLVIGIILGAFGLAVPAQVVEAVGTFAAGGGILAMLLGAP